MSAARILIVVVIILVVLFATSVGLGLSSEEEAAREDRNAVNKPDDWVNAVKGALVDEQPLEPETVQTRCRVGNRFIIRAGATCRIEIPASDTDIRKASLRLEGRGKVIWTLEPPEGSAIPRTRTLEPGESQELEVFKAGGTLIFSCVEAPDRCRVRVERP